MKTNASMNKIFAFTLSILLVVITISSCTKTEGEGGTSTITGTIIMQQIDNQGVITEYDAFKQDVYIIYGNDSIYSDDMKTNYDGSYRFRYLYQGSYTIYAYTECELCPGQRDTVMATVEITDNRKTFAAPAIYIQDFASVN